MHVRIVYTKLQIIPHQMADKTTNIRTTQKLQTVLHKIHVLQCTILHLCAFLHIKVCIATNMNTRERTPGYIHHIHSCMQARMYACTHAHAHTHTIHYNICYIHKFTKIINVTLHNVYINNGSSWKYQEKHM